MKNIVIGFLIVAVIAEGYILFTKKSSPVVAGVQTQGMPRPSGRPPAPIAKGDTLIGSPMEKFAFEVAPTLTDDAKKAITGFAIKSQKLADGSVQVTFVPKDSGDQSQQYTVKPGNKLYFIEMTPVDDKTDTDRDANYRDDYGIIVDARGTIQ